MNWKTFFATVAASVVAGVLVDKWRNRNQTNQTN